MINGNQPFLTMCLAFRLVLIRLSRIKVFKLKTPKPPFLAPQKANSTGVTVLNLPPPYHASLKLSSICKSASQALLIRMQLTLHATRSTPHDASRLVQAISAWSVKTRYSPFQHCRDARVRLRPGMNIEYTPPFPTMPTSLWRKSLYSVAGVILCTYDLALTPPGVLSPVHPRYHSVTRLILCPLYPASAARLCSGQDPGSIEASDESDLSQLLMCCRCV